MLKKLLKYDLKAAFKYWWMFALASFGISLIGGISILVLEDSENFPHAIIAFARIALIIVIMGIGAVSVAVSILNFARFYKNFFTDEGYLTFTLPVSRAQLLNSKVIMSEAVISATMLMIFLDAIVIAVVGYYKEVFTATFWQAFFGALNEIINAMGIYFFIYIFEAIVLMLLFIAMSNLIMFCCITVASIITKKAKLITAIGIYYAASGLFSTAVEIAYIFGLPSMSLWLSAIPETAVAPLVALILLVVILFAAMLCCVLYVLQYWMLDRKLNLS